MSKLRVYMVAKELGIDNKSLVALFQSLGVRDVRNHMSAVAPEQIERVRRHLSKPGDGDQAVEERVRPRGGGVIIRRGKRKADERRADEPRAESRPAATSSAQPNEEPARAVPPVRRKKSETARMAPTKATPPSGAAATGSGTAATETAPSSPSVSATNGASPSATAQGDGAVASATADAGAAAASARAVGSTESSSPTEAQPSGAKPEAAKASEVSPEAVSAEAPAGSASEAPATVKSAAPAAPEQTAAAQNPSAQVVSAAEVPATPAGHVPAAQRPVEQAPVKAPAEPVAATQSAAAQTATGQPTAEPSPSVASPEAAAAPTAAQASGQPRASAPSAPAAPAGKAAASPASSSAPAKAAAEPPREAPKPRPKTGIDVWQGRPGVPMPQQPRSSVTPRRVQYDAKAGGGQRRGPMMGGRMGRGPRRGIGGMGGGRSKGSGSGAPVTQERSAHKKVVKIEGSVALQTLAAKMQVKAGELLMKLMGLGMTGININSTLDPDTAKIVGEEFGWNIEDVAVSEDDKIAAAQETTEDEADREPRPPVVTVMGHVDHGKTSLLDSIRKSSVADGEAGGITQHIGAYSVKTDKGRITFLDTPGHAAFTAMRARGAKATDIVILVCAADDGVMPQTKEAISHAKDAGCPIVVAVNKIDKPDAQPERARRELSESGLVPEEWGGDTLVCEVSAKTGDGIPELLDAVLLQAEVLALRANPKRSARGMVIEAKLDRGRGPLATVLVQEGTLRKGDGLIAGAAHGRVRAMLDENGRSVSEAGPAMPVAVVGLNEVPSAGDNVDAVKDAKKAQEIADQRKVKATEQNRGSKATMSLEEWAKGISQADMQELKLIVKADVQGSQEALVQALEELSTEKVKVGVVHSGVGAVTEGDVNLAVAAKGVIIGFNVRPAGKARVLAQKEGVEIRHHTIIYEVIDAIKDTMQGMLAPKLVEEAIGKAEVRKIFKVSKAGVVAGCMVIDGVVRRNAMMRLQREGSDIWEGKLDSLKRFKDDAKEVREGLECGIAFSGHSDLQEGDIIAAFEMKEVRATL